MVHGLTSTTFIQSSSFSSSSSRTGEGAERVVALFFAAGDGPSSKAVSLTLLRSAFMTERSKIPRGGKRHGRVWCKMRCVKQHRERKGHRREKEG